MKWDKSEICLDILLS